MASPTPLASTTALFSRSGGVDGELSSDLAPSDPSASAQLIGHLGRACDRNGLPDLATRLTELQAWVAAELKNFEVQ